mmetsp:Transcript_9501/g.22378  ORF Transcript_9501/g.22378 Transcript_9501/m.22378 type:complete len:258 (-) Transcript_9501:48-821(-)
MLVCLPTLLTDMTSLPKITSRTTFTWMPAVFCFQLRSRLPKIVVPSSFVTGSTVLRSRPKGGVLMACDQDIPLLFWLPLALWPVHNPSGVPILAEEARNSFLWTLARNPTFGLATICRPTIFIGEVTLPIHLKPLFHQANPKSHLKIKPSSIFAGKRLPLAFPQVFFVHRLEPIFHEHPNRMQDTVEDPIEDSVVPVCGLQRNTPISRVPVLGVDSAHELVVVSYNFMCRHILTLLGSAIPPLDQILIHHRLDQMVG